MVKCKKLLLFFSVVLFSLSLFVSANAETRVYGREMFLVNDPSAEWTLVRTLTGNQTDDTANMVPVDLNQYTEALVLVEYNMGSSTAISADIAPVFLRTEDTGPYSSDTKPTGVLTTITGSAALTVIGGSWFWLAVPRVTYTTLHTTASISVYTKGK